MSNRATDRAREVVSGEGARTNHQRIYEAARGLSLELDNLANRLPVSCVEELHELVEWLDDSVKDVLHVADQLWSPPKSGTAAVNTVDGVVFGSGQVYIVPPDAPDDLDASWYLNVYPEDPS